MAVTFPDSDVAANTCHVSMERAFSYEALNTDSKSFRFIEVLPDHESNPIRFKLSSSCLDDDCPAYTTLSYTWQCDPP